MMVLFDTMDEVNKGLLQSGGLHVYRVGQIEAL